MSLVHGHGLLGKALLVVLVFLSQRLHLGLEFLHLLHGGVALVAQRPEDDLDDDGQKDDGEAVVTDVLVKKFQYQQQRHGKPLHP